MKQVKYDIVIIGGGPAGLAAAISAKQNGCSSVLILERDKELGGILNQCIHNGFGLHTFREELTGPEYALRYIKQVKEMHIEYKLNTMVMSIQQNKLVKTVVAMSQNEGLIKISSKALILAMGCRERSRGALNIPGYRPAGIFSAGTAQRYVNIEGYMPGREVVILGSGDIGLIMARRMTLEGANVKVVAEIMPFSGGLKRNIVQCLDDFNIPLKLSHTVVDIEGKNRVEAVTIAKVDDKMQPIKGTEARYTCDTLLLSVGLIPENELSQNLNIKLNPVTKGAYVNESLETNVDGVFACGNVLHVHDLVDYVSEEASCAGKNAAKYVLNKEKVNKIFYTEVLTQDGVTYCIPSKINLEKVENKLTFRMRVNNIYKNCYLCVYVNDNCIKKQKKKVMAPGEMETVVLYKKELLKYSAITTITFKIEDEKVG